MFGAAASHTTLMNTQWDKVDHLPRAHAFRDGLARAADLLGAARPDAVVIVGSNHFRGVWLDLMPAFTLGVGEVISTGEHGAPAGPLPSDPALALAICEGLVQESFDLAFSARLTVDHGISHAYQWLMAGPELSAVPVIPLVINAFAPPLPSLKRCEALGGALRRVIGRLPAARRIAVVATGGLSHQLPFPDWRRPEGEDEAFLAMSWLEGREDWRRFEARRRGIVVNAAAQLNPEFDTWLLGRLERDGLRGVSDDLTDEALLARAGNGGAEVRAWLVMAHALGGRPGRAIAYSEMPEWLTGMAVAVVDPSLEAAR